MNINKVNFKNDDLKNYAIELLNGDFRVFVSENKHNTNESTTFLKFEKNNNIGYCQLNDFIGFSFSSVHKPNRTTGTGFQIESEVLNPTLQNALNSFVVCPNWASDTDRQSVVKYKNIEESFKDSISLNYVELEKEKDISLSEYMPIVRDKLSVCELERLKAEGYTNECFFKNDLLTEQYGIKLMEKKKYYYLNFGSSGAFMVLKEDITTKKNGDFLKNSVFGIKGYGTPNFKKCYGNILNLDIEKLHKLRHDYRR